MNKISKLVVSRLKSKKINLSVAESCTGGMLAQNITSVSGASKVFAFGIITYSNQSKIKYLNVPREIIKKYGAVSEECCYSMLVNLEKISKSNLYVVITGVAGPNGGTKIKPVGLVYIGIKKGKKIEINNFLFKNQNRDSIRKSSVKKTLEIIKKFI
tara:strand:- start:154 stop:624 length:471 start_codon:yes stop_codon:yes gene_type:complete